MQHPLTLAHPLLDVTSPEGAAVHIVIPPETFLDPDGDPFDLRVTLADGSPLPPWLAFDGATGVISGTPPAGFAGALSVRVVAIELPEQPTGASPVDRSGLVLTFTGSPLLRLDPVSDTGTAGDNITTDRTPTLFGDAPAGTAEVELRFFDSFGAPLHSAVL